MTIETLKSEYITTNGIKLHCKIAGEGETIILLHGFPDFWYTWHQTIPFLIEENYKIIAPDLRGYHKSDVPPNVEDYKIDILIKDIAGLIQQTANKKATLVAHDWGGAIAWKLAEKHPELVKKLIIINCPYPDELRKALKRNFIQMFKSYYFALFRMGGFADWAIHKYRVPFFKRLLQKNIYTTQPVPQEVLDNYSNAFANKKNVTAGINYYRAIFLKDKNSTPRVVQTATIRHNIPQHQKTAHNLDKQNKDIIPKITCPTLVIWGCQDAYLGRELVFNTPKYCLLKPEIIYIKDAGHWVHLQKSEQVNNLILRFLKRKHLAVDMDLTQKMGFNNNMQVSS